MNRTTTEFYGQKVLVLGFARSGYSTALFLINNGAEVTVSALNDGNLKDEVNQLEKQGVSFVWGPHPVSLLNKEFNYIVKNPGIPYTIPFLVEAQKRNISIYTEIEITSPFIPRTIAITGSNGKTTTTTLIHELVNTVSDNAIVCGNIGRPVTDAIVHEPSNSDFVMELSSFQLQGTNTFKPHIAILLNLTPSHLDYHTDFLEYTEAKAMITKNQDNNDYLIYNIEDYYVKEIAESSQATTIPFSTHSFNEYGASVKDGWIYFDGSKVMKENEVALPGKHNLENVLAALITAKLYKVSDDIIIKMFKEFTGVKHRLQFVDEIEGRRFYNDSKATNVPATKNAVFSFNQKPILIAGGLDRGNDFVDFLPVLDQCEKAYLIGQSGSKIEELAKKNQMYHIEYVEHLEIAVRKAYESSNEGDVILLSPACASWDQYSSFEVRGDSFISLINSLKQCPKKKKKEDKQKNISL